MSPGKREVQILYLHPIISNHSVCVSPHRQTDSGREETQWCILPQHSTFSQEAFKCWTFSCNCLGAQKLFWRLITFTFTFTHLPDAFIHSLSAAGNLGVDIKEKIYSVCVFFTCSLIICFCVFCFHLYFFYFSFLLISSFISSLVSSSFLLCFPFLSVFPLLSFPFLFYTCLSFFVSSVLSYLNLFLISPPNYFLPPPLLFLSIFTFLFSSFTYRLVFHSNLPCSH